MADAAVSVGPSGRAAENPPSPTAAAAVIGNTVEFLRLLDLRIFRHTDRANILSISFGYREPSRIAARIRGGICGTPHRRGGDRPPRRLRRAKTCHVAELCAYGCGADWARADAVLSDDRDRRAHHRHTSPRGAGLCAGRRCGTHDGSFDRGCAAGASRFLRFTRPYASQGLSALLSGLVGFTLARTLDAAALQSCWLAGRVPYGRESSCPSASSSAGR